MSSPSLIQFRNCLIKLIPSIKERYCKGQELVMLNSYPRLGITDSSIERLAVGKFLILTVDSGLFQHLCAIGVDVVNFNHLRPLNWQ